MKKSIIFVLIMPYILWSCDKKTVNPDAEPMAFFSLKELHQGSIQFQNLSKNADFYEWDFGDGTTSKIESPIKQYENPGSYLVKLTVTHENGTLDKTSGYVNISKVPTMGGVVFWTNYDAGIVDIYINNIWVGANTSYVSGTNVAHCGMSGLITSKLTDGTYDFVAKSRKKNGKNWSGSITISDNLCLAYHLK